MMSKQDDLIPLESREEQEAKSALEEFLREGARQKLQASIENAVAEYIKKYTGEKNENGHRLVTRNDHLQERSIQTGIGELTSSSPVFMIVESLTLSSAKFFLYLLTANRTT